MDKALCGRNSIRRRYFRALKWLNRISMTSSAVARSKILIGMLIGVAMGWTFGSFFASRKCVDAVSSVQEAFKDILGRQADETGLLEYVRALTENRMQLETVRSQIMSSEEMRGLLHRGEGIESAIHPATVGKVNVLAREQGVENFVLDPLTASPRRCACGDVYHEESQRCFMQDPAIVLWVGGYGSQKVNASFLTKLAPRLQEVLVKSEFYRGTHCLPLPEGLPESLVAYTYSWLDAREMNKLYTTCRLVPPNNKHCFQAIDDNAGPPGRNIWAQQDQRQVLAHACFSLKPAFIVKDSVKKIDMSLTVEDLSRALKLNSPRSANQKMIKSLVGDSASTIMFSNISTLCGWKVHELALMPSLEYSTKIKVAAITVCKNEVATVAFTVGALIEHVHVYIVVDSGSEDGTVLLLRSLFAEQIETGKLQLVLTSSGEDMMVSRNVALDIAREKECSHIIKIDADDVLYDHGATQLLDSIQHLPSDVSLLWVSQVELHQSAIDDTSDWIRSVISDLEWSKNGHVFRRNTTQPFGHDRVYKLSPDLTAAGRWLDESRGLLPESFYHSGPVRFSFLITSKPLLAHYGWARPLNRLRMKQLAWHRTMSSALDSVRGTVPFLEHPEIFSRIALQAYDIIKQQLPERFQGLKARLNGLGYECDLAEQLISRLSLISRASRSACVMHAASSLNAGNGHFCRCFSSVVRQLQGGSVRQIVVQNSSSICGRSLCSPHFFDTSLMEVVEINTHGLSASSFDQVILYVQDPDWNSTGFLDLSWQLAREFSTVTLLSCAADRSSSKAMGWQTSRPGWNILHIHRWNAPCGQVTSFTYFKTAS